VQAENKEQPILPQPFIEETCSLQQEISNNDSAYEEACGEARLEFNPICLGQEQTAQVHGHYAE